MHHVVGVSHPHHGKLLYITLYHHGQLLYITLYHHADALPVHSVHCFLSIVLCVCFCGLMFHTVTSRYNTEAQHWGTCVCTNDVRVYAQTMCMYIQHDYISSRMQVQHRTSSSGNGAENGSSAQCSSLTLTAPKTR